MAGRNDPCPCGSGKKYKRCCLSKDESTARNVRAAKACVSKSDSEPDKFGVVHSIGEDSGPKDALLKWISAEAGHRNLFAFVDLESDDTYNDDLDGHAQIEVHLICQHGHSNESWYIEHDSEDPPDLWRYEGSGGGGDSCPFGCFDYPDSRVCPDCGKLLRVTCTKCGEVIEFSREQAINMYQHGGLWSCDPCPHCGETLGTDVEEGIDG